MKDSAKVHNICSHSIQLKRTVFAHFHWPYISNHSSKLFESLSLLEKQALIGVLINCQINLCSLQLNSTSCLLSNMEGRHNLIQVRVYVDTIQVGGTTSLLTLQLYLKLPSLSNENAPSYILTAKMNYAYMALSITCQQV